MSIQAIAFTMMLAGAGQQNDPAVLPEIVVEAAPRTVETARRYVDQVAGAPRHAISLATWQTPLCVETVNLRADAAQIIIAQITARAADVGVETRTSACRPNVSLIGTSDGRYTAAELTAAYPKAFKASSGDTQGDPSDLRRFVERDAPVRWWTISAQFDTEHRVFAEPLWNAQAVRRETGAASMFNQNLVRAMVQTIVIIDANRTAAASAEALADYIAMTVLAEVNPDAVLGSEATVLRLWEPQSDVSGMTPWDVRYLGALYCARVTQPGAGAPIRSRFQLADIARRMMDAPHEERSASGRPCD